MPSSDLKYNSSLLILLFKNVGLLISINPAFEGPKYESPLLGSSGNRGGPRGGFLEVLSLGSSHFFLFLTIL